MNTLGPITAVMSVCFFVEAGAAQTSFYVQRGQSIAETHCSQCHAVGRSDVSSLSVAPALRDLHKLYPVEHLEEALAEGIYTGHPEMPLFQFEPDQINDLIAYLKSLE